MTQAIIELDNISLKLGNKQILEDVSLTVNKGEFLTITGPSGSGKSTLLKIIGSLIQPSEGKVTFEGKNIYDIPMTDYRKEVSYFFQNAILFGDTVKDNLSFPYEIRGEEFDRGRAENLLAKLKLDASIIEKSINDISGGEKQRVALVRNLLFQPKVLLLDEITSSLDRENRETIYQLLENQQEAGTTILMVTHNEEEKDLASRLIEVTEGKVSV